MIQLLWIDQNNVALNKVYLKLFKVSEYVL